MSATSLRLYRGIIATSLVVGLATLVLSAVLAFEEPSNRLLYGSVILLFAPVAAVFVHLAFTKTLTTEQRRTWLAHLASRRFIWVLGEYFSCDNLGAGAMTLSRPGEPHNGADAAH